mmetsp:Transcript_26177/g.72212  ORF Transcript_26177/g.72212 Transcript_26177/m.72212 type:complete len:2075 (+) Transcript_26177:112-6336(+)
MFSSLNQLYKSVTSGINLSPQAIIASYLAKALGEFFLVDPTTVETQLAASRKAHILLPYVAIKPRLVEGESDNHIVITGNVEEIKFSWEWGDGNTGSSSGTASSFVRNVSLRICGLRVLIRRATAKEYLDLRTNRDENETTSMESPGEKSGSDWKDKYMAQILDHLRLDLDDIKITIALSPASSFVVEASGLELVTLLVNRSEDSNHAAVGNQDSADIVQRVCMASLSASVVGKDVGENGSTQTHPLLDPMGYRATIRRIHGRRFLDGIMNGLIVTGEQILDAEGSKPPNGIKVHLGVTQLQALSHLQEMLQLVDVNETIKGDIQTELIGDNKQCSRFILPIQYISASVGERQSAEIQLDGGCTIHYSTDGSLFSIDGGETGSQISIDGQSFISTNCGDETGRIVFDMVRSCVQIQPAELVGTDPIAIPPAEAAEAERRHEMSQAMLVHLTCLQSQLEKLKDVMKPIANGFTFDQQSYEDSQPAGWSCIVNGKMKFSVQLDNQKSFDVTSLGFAVRPNTEVSTSSLRPFCLDCEGIHLLANKGDLTIDVPSFALLSSGPVTFQGTIQVKLPTLKSGLGVQAALDQALSLNPFPSLQAGKVGESVNPTGSGKVEVGSLVDVSVPGVLVSIAEQEHSLYIHSLCGTKTMWRCGSLVVKSSVNDLALAPSVAQFKLSMSDLCLGTIRHTSADQKMKQENEQLNSLPGLPLAVAWARIDVTSSIGLSAEISGGTTCWGAKAFNFTGPSQVRLPSFETISYLQTRMEYVVNELLSAKQSHIPSKCTDTNLSGWEGFDMPFQLVVPSLQISLAKSETMPGGAVRAEGLVGIAVHWNCRTLNLQGLVDHEAKIDATNLSVSVLETGPSAQFRVVSATTPFGRLQGPIEKVMVSMKSQEKASVALGYLDIVLQRNNSGIPSSQGGQQPASDKSSDSVDLFAMIPYDIELTADAIRLTTAQSLFEGGAFMLECRSFRTSLDRQIDEGTTTQLRCNANLDLISAKTPHGGVKLANAAVTAVLAEARGLLSFQGLGGILEGIVDIGSLETVDSSAYGSLSAPVHGIRLELSPDEIKVALDSICWDLCSWIAGTNLPPSLTSTSVSPKERSLSLFALPPLVVRWNSVKFIFSAMKAEDTFVEIKRGSIKLAIDRDLNTFVETPESTISLYLSTMGDWVEVCLSSPTAHIEGFSKSKIPFRVRAASMDVAAASFKSISMHIPSFQSSHNASEIVVNNTVDIAFSSMKTMDSFSNFMMQFSQLFNREVDPLGALANHDLAAADTVPALVVPTASLSILEPEPGMIVANDIRALNGITCDSICVEGFSPGAKVYVSVFELTLNNEIRGTFCLDEGIIPDACELSNPCHGINVVYANDTLVLSSPNVLQLKSPAILASAVEQTPHSDNHHKQSTNALQLPFDFQASFSAIHYRTEESGHVICDSPFLALRRELQSVSFHCTLRSLVLAVESLASSIRGISIEGSMEAFEEASKPYDFPGVGRLLQAKLELEEINELAVKGTGKLRQPCPLSLVFHGPMAEVKAGSVDWQVYASSQNDNGDVSTPFSLPFPVVVTVDEFSAGRLSKTQELVQLLACRGAQLRFDPIQPQKSLLGAQVNVSDIICFEMVRVPRLSASFNLQPHDISIFYNLSVNLDSMEVEADFSQKGWSDALENESSSVLYKIPDAQVSETVLRANLKGHVVKLEDANLYLKPFSGDRNSDSQSLTKHYISALKERIPFLLAKANVAGMNVGDSLGQVAAAALLNSGMAGSVVGVVGRDAVGGAISRGKSSRGAQESERYHFGDFSRGAAASIADAASSRRSEGKAGQGVKSYVSDNRVRLGSAAGSGVGMAVGMAVAGPIGLVAGSIVAGQAAARMIEESCGDPKKKKMIADHTPTPIPTQERGRVSATTVTASNQHSRQQNSQLHLNQASQPHYAGQSPIPAVASNPYNHQPNDQTLVEQLNLNQRNQPYYAGQSPMPAVASNLYNHQPNDQARGEQLHLNQRNQPHYAGQEHVFSQQGQGLSMQAPPGSTHHYPQQESETHSQQSQERSSGYQFGNLTQGIVSRGKKSRGKDDKANYKFGDFTRGLFS